MVGWCGLSTGECRPISWSRYRVLFSLGVADYPHATRKVVSWDLLGMGRLSRQPGDLTADPLRRSVIGDWVQVEQAPQPGSPHALLLVDEVGALGSAARHLH